MTRGYRILVCCGTAGATATVLVDKLENKLRELGLELDRIDKIQIGNLQSMVSGGDYDIVVTAVDIQTNELSLSVPVVRAMGILTGLNEEEDLQRIVEILKKTKTK